MKIERVKRWVALFLVIVWRQHTKQGMNGRRCVLTHCHIAHVNTRQTHAHWGSPYLHHPIHLNPIILHRFVQKHKGCWSKHNGCWSEATTAYRTAASQRTQTNTLRIELGCTRGKLEKCSNFFFQRSILLKWSKTVLYRPETMFFKACPNGASTIASCPKMRH